MRLYRRGDRSDTYDALHFTSGLWECGECGCCYRVSHTPHVCGECGTAGSMRLADIHGDASFAMPEVGDMREFWLLRGMQEPPPLS